MSVVFFFFNDTATTEIYTLSLHDALPISSHVQGGGGAGARALPRRAARGVALPRGVAGVVGGGGRSAGAALGDRKSTRLNSSHSQISYAVFCLKKKKDNPILLTCLITPSG